MLVKSLISEPAEMAICCHPGDSVNDTVFNMVERHLNAVAVTEQDSTLVGILTDHDVMRALHDGNGQIGNAQVYEWMSDKVITCTPDTSIEDALKLMGKHRIHHLVIVEDGKSLGPLSIRDVLARVHENDEMQINILRDIAVAARVSSAA